MLIEPAFNGRGLVSYDAGMLSGYARTEWSVILAVGALLSASAGLLGWWWVMPLPMVAAVVLVLFFRDPLRRPPSQRGAVVAVCDGRVSSIHEVERFEPFDGPAVCVRVFMSVFAVHLNRTPCHGKVRSISERPGNFGNTLNPASIEDNQSTTTVLVHPAKGYPLAAVRQVAGMLARTIHNGLREGQIVQRGQRMGIIKLGSTTELYLPASLSPSIAVTQGQAVLAGETVLAHVATGDAAAAASQRVPFKERGSGSQANDVEDDAKLGSDVGTDADTDTDLDSGRLASASA